MGLFGFLSKEKKDQLDQGLEKTKDGFFSKIARAVAGKATVDEAFLDDLEEILITSDVGLETTVKIIDKIEGRVAEDKYINTKELNEILRSEISELLNADGKGNTENFRDILTAKPYVIMVVGVNGVGKTTTIGKLAFQFKSMGLNVLIGAADTFRAAAIDQLEIWSDRVEVPLVKRKMGSDPASVAYDTLESALAKEVDVVIVDTAGRLHTKVNLMNELSKVKNVMQKLIPEAPHEILLVLDASTGQNAVEQAKHFTKATNVNSICVTKLDGTAKGGVVLGIVDQFKIPIRYIGIGEKKEDLQLFDSREFVDSLFKN